ncbi:hypothetical protein SBRCBS47491_002819 [Sporothrix bragantina]|uniref:Translation initiation factor n=1 Tax=Sporothrix bragantina TaxID=671064 RepID=A0ABP0BA07_9PEZI
MKTTACIFTPATALSRVFLSSTGSRQIASNSCSTSRGSAVLLSQFSQSQGNVSTTQRRCIYQGTSPRGSGEGFARRPNQAPPPNNFQGGSRPLQRNTPHLARKEDFFGDSAEASNEGSQTQRQRPPQGGNTGGGGDAAATFRKQSNAIPGLAARIKGGNKVRMPRDRDINYNHVILKNRDGSLSEPRPTATVLRGLHRITESLVMLSYPNTDGPRNEPTSRFPICFIVNRIEERKQEADLLAAARKKVVAKKELELNWSIESHDLGHRLKKLHGFLEKGLLVEMTLMRKKGKREATKPEAQQLLRRIRETIAEVPGSKETKAMEGELLRTVRLAIQGPSAKKKKELGG